MILMAIWHVSGLGLPRLKQVGEKPKSHYYSFFQL